MDMIIEQNIMVPMRDRVRLATDVFRPAQEGQYPVLLTRVPYNKDLPALYDPNKRIFLELSLDAARVVAAGYVIVIQDTRGRYASEGEFNPMADEAADGADAVAWAAVQPWSSGQVGMFGESYQGLTQWLAAREQPAALRAIAPMHAPLVHSTVYTYYGGAFQPATFLEWALTQGATGEMQRRVAQGRASQAELDALVQAEQSLGTVFERLPLADQPLLEGVAPYYFEWLDPAGQAAQHVEGQRTLYPSVTVPALIIGGWYDFFLPATLAHYRQVKQRGGSALARRPRLIVGPWTHVDFPVMFAERDYGPLASTRAIDLTGIQLRWFDRWLKGIDNGVEQEKPVRIFVMGVDQWREEADWPLSDTQYRRYYLHSAGRANSSAGDGLLSTDAPGDEPADAYCYDPRNPVPTVGGAIMLQVSPTEFNTGPLDQCQVEGRDDLLCYTTPPLERPVEVTGPIELVLYVSSSARDTDFTAKLVDVYPDGRAEILTDGILRARYRESLTEPVLIEPGRIYELRIDVGATANVFRAGHRMRLEVSSSNFPRFDRNTNTGGTIALERIEDCVQAINRIHHNRAHPSHLILPIVERRASLEAM
jgi:putative CocE/NonD family hydrolase